MCAQGGINVARREPDLEKACGRDEEDEGRIWIDLLVEELQVFAGIKANDGLHPSCPQIPQI